MAAKPKARSGSGRTKAELEAELKRLAAERDESEAQKAALAEVQGVINSSAGDLQPVFDAILDKALRLCKASFGVLWTYNDELSSAAAIHGASAAYREFLREPHRPGPGSAQLRLIQGVPFVHVEDLANSDDYPSGDALPRALVDLGGGRTLLACALRKDGAYLGSIMIYRREVRAFSDKDIALLQNFAAQAVIAMENARLITEMREALEQQTATAEILQVISSSTTDAQPVFEAIVERATKLCDAEFAGVARYDDGLLQLVATNNLAPEEAEAFHQLFPRSPSHGFAMGRAFLAKRPVVVDDVLTDPSYDRRTQATLLALTKYRTFLGVPIMQDGEAIGVIGCGRRDVKAFTPEQLELMSTFADQAVIAIENARLITETREALEQQTATAEVLGVINASPGNLTPVFSAMLEKATRVCAADAGVLVTYDGERFWPVAHRGFSQFPRAPIRAHPEIGIGRIERGEDIVHILDSASGEAYTSGNLARRAIVELGGARSQLTAALRKEGVLLGAFTIWRKEVRPFTEKQIVLLQNFAAQAVIAMENARLLGDLRERTDDLQQSLEYQTATSDVLKVISRSTFDLRPVLQTLVETAVRLCEADFGHLDLPHDGVFRPAATLAFSAEFEAVLRGTSFVPDRGTTVGRVLLEKGTVHVADVTRDPNYAFHEAVALGNVHAVLGVPLLRGEEIIGVFALGRERTEGFTERQIELVRTFADQAVIAIENTRLITETREALEQQTATAEVLGVINSSPGDLVPVFDAILEKAHSLCGVIHGTLQLYDGERFRAVATHGYREELTQRLREAWRPGPNNPSQTLLRGGDLVHIPDLSEIDDPMAQNVAQLGGIRTVLMVALRKDNTLLGMITTGRDEVRPHTNKEIALLQNFAAQAVIAMDNARLITETREALEQQTATADVLGVINSSPGDLAPVFDAMLEKAHTLCGAAHGSLQIYDGEKLCAVATKGVSNPFADILRQGYPAASSPASRELIAGSSFTHILDCQKVDHPVFRSAAELAGIRTVLFVPLRKDDAFLGLISAARLEVRPFTEKQIALLQNFAAQAVIAMENARLITETQDALDRQTATAEVLQVINSSPGDLAPVWDAMLDKALSICQAALGGLLIYEAGRFRTAALRGAPPAFAEFLHEPLPPEGALALIVRGEPLVQIANVTTDPAYTKGVPARHALADLGGARTAVWLALRKDDALLGVIWFYRQEVRPFTDKQIALLKNFAAQAVIAMENARLITETKEALDQQTATAEVLGVINSSPGDLKPVFDAMLDKATRLSEAAFGILWTYDGERFQAVAFHDVPPAYVEFLREPQLASPVAPLGRLARGEAFAHVSDLAAEEYHERAGLLVRQGLSLGGFRTVLAVPLRKDASLLGAITIYRREVQPFSEKQITLLQNFAAQAVIAMENARLLDEIRQRQAELRVTFDNMADGVAMFDPTLHLAAWNRNFQELLDLPDELLAERPGFDEYIRYLTERGEFGESDPETEIARLRSRLGDHYSFERTRPDGTVIEVRHNPMPDGGVVLIFSDVTERKRSEEEIRAARDAAEAAYRDLQAAQSSLVQAQKMAALGQLTAGIAHEIKNPLNFVNNFASLSTELLDELQEDVRPALASLNGDKREAIDETFEMLTGNLDKIVEHGQRADNIVKSMLEHSRGVSGERREVDLNALIEEALNLAYHGARAQDQSFNITLERDYAASLRPIEVAPQEMTRVFLNLFGNGFYAANKRVHAADGDSSFRPVLAVTTREDGDAVEVRVRDNGTGIPPEVKDKLFQPFFTTKPTGEGTGLGLSISYDIVTQQHGGTISVESEENAYTEFTIRLPRH